MLENFNYQQFKLANDYEGEVEATFINASSNTYKRPVVLYIHGFIDYFFHPHVSLFLDEAGYDFCALELRKYGHSILPHQHPNYCRSMEEYFEEVDKAILKIKELNQEELILMGHSTGGLVSSLYLNKGNQRDKVDALVLNSPFLEMNVPSFSRKLLKPLSKWVGALLPFAKLDGMLPPTYASSVHEAYNGEWKFNLKFKPIEGFPVYFKWSRAIMNAQDELKMNSNIKQPILLLHSSDSYIPTKHEGRVMKSDIVLNVEHMKKYGPGLGKNVTMIEIQDGMHDLFLSQKEVREQALTKMTEWLAESV